MLVRLFGDSGVPLYGENRVPLVWSERYYPKSAASAVADCLTRHDWARLRSIAQSQVPAIRLVAYHTPDEGFVACQAFKYVELEERPSRSCTSCVPATRRSGVRRYAAEPDGVRHRPVPRDFGSRPDC